MLCFGASLYAQTFSAPRLLNVIPAGAKVGSEGMVEISGQGMESVSSLKFSHAGIRAAAKGSNYFLVSVGPEVPPGIYDVRAMGTNGLSNPRAFAVGVLNEVLETKNSSDAPQGVALGATVNGRTEANAVDYFRFTAKHGQRVLVECDTREIDSKLEPVLALYDHAGRELARSRTSRLLDHAVTTDGEFTLRLHDIIYRGGPEFFYRLSIGTFPHIDYALPLADGAKARFAIFGRNLPGGQGVGPKGKSRLERIEVELAKTDASLSKPLVNMPAQAALDLLEYRLHNQNGVSEPVLIRFPNSLVVAEQEPNNLFTAAQKIDPPCEIMGTFHPGGDRDWFSFEAKKGDVYWLEVVSHRLGYATDPLLLVQRATTNGTADIVELNDSEANFGGAEFNTTHRDPAGKFEAKEDGTYLIQLRDLFSHPAGSSPMAYQLAIRKPAPDFRLAALPVSPLPAKKDAKEIGITSASLRRGETMPVKVFAFRRDGFAGEIALNVNVPSGISASPGRIESGKNSALLFLSAITTEAAPSRGALTLRGTAHIDGSEVTRTAAPLTIVWGTADPAAEAAIARVAADNPLALTDATLPVQVRPQSDVINSVTGKTVKVNFVVDRSESFAGGLKLKPFGFPALDSLAELDVDAKATNLTLQIDLREKKIPAGTYVFTLQVSPQAKPQTDQSKKPKEPPPAFYSEPVVLQVNPGTPPPQTNSPAK